MIKTANKRGNLNLSNLSINNKYNKLNKLNKNRINVQIIILSPNKQIRNKLKPANVKNNLCCLNKTYSYTQISGYNSESIDSYAT